MIPRTLGPHARNILEKYGKMAFVSGPRQVGKTTLAHELRKGYVQSVYFNWDVVTDQKKILSDPYFFEKENRDLGHPFLVVFDEVHKYARWRGYLKGAYDRYRDEFHFLVTGSGRLDLFKKGGESLLGRYLGLPLFPFTVAEILGRWPSWREFKERLSEPPRVGGENREAYEGLLKLSGFPEPFTRAEEAFYNVWSPERKKLLVREDIRDASNIREISLMEMLAHVVPGRVGSPLSINAIREDIGVAFETARDWLLILEAFYYLFRIHPYSRHIVRAIRKEAKAYLFDWGEIQDPAARFENMVALHLFKAVHSWRATGEGEVALHYVRDKQKREVDFVVTEKGVPVVLVECKRGEESFSPALDYFQRALKAPVAVQILDKTGILKKLRADGFVRWIVSADRWLAMLP